MRRMWTVLAILFAVAAGAAGGGAYVRLDRQREAPAVTPTDPQPEAAPVARVQAVPLRVEEIPETLATLGTVEAAPGETQTFSVPFESRVRRVLVVTGQCVEDDQPLIEVEPSPDSMLQLDQARQERDAAMARLDFLKQRQEMKLATRQDVLQGTQDLAAADLHVSSLEKRGVDGRQTLRAGAPCIVDRIDVQQGEIVAAGAPLLETVGRNAITVRLGVESEDARRLRPGLSVHIRPVNGSGEAFDGRVNGVARAVNPQTRLVTVTVKPAPDAHLLLNQYVSGVISVASRQGLVAPAAAVLPEGDVNVLYTVKDGRAVRHEVKAGLRSGRQVELVGSDLKAGQMAVVVGNSQLEDGMALEVEKAQ